MGLFTLGAHNMGSRGVGSSLGPLFFLPLCTNVVEEEFSEVRLTSRGCDNDLDPRLRRVVVDPKQVAVTVLVRAASLLVEVVPTHINKHEPFGDRFGADDRGAGGHQPLRAVCLRRASECRLDLFVISYGDASCVREDETRKGVAVSNGLQVPGSEGLTVANEEGLEVFLLLGLLGHIASLVRSLGGVLRILHSISGVRRGRGILTPGPVPVSVPG
jgi:hypothetical protein